MLFAFVLAALTVAGWAMTPKLRKTTTNQALGWVFHILGVTSVYMLAVLVMLYSKISPTTLSYYYDCLIIIGGASAIFIGFKIFLRWRSETKLKKAASPGLPQPATPAD